MWRALPSAAFCRAFFVAAGSRNPLPAALARDAVDFRGDYRRDIQTLRGFVWPGAAAR
jgi:hypothetical protein